MVGFEKRKRGYNGEDDSYRSRNDGEKVVHFRNLEKEEWLKFQSSGVFDVKSLPLNVRLQFLRVKSRRNF